MVRIHSALGYAVPPGGARLVLQIHDEFLLEVAGGCPAFGDTIAFLGTWKLVFVLPRMLVSGCAQFPFPAIPALIALGASPTPLPRHAQRTCWSRWRAWCGTPWRAAWWRPARGPRCACRCACAWPSGAAGASCRSWSCPERSPPSTFYSGTARLEAAPLGCLPAGPNLYMLFYSFILPLSLVPFPLLLCS